MDSLDYKLFKDKAQQVFKLMFKNISFILHKPQLSENIGACARAMKNFNFTNLTVIDPKPSFPNDKIIATAVGAQEVIKKAKIYKNLKKL